MWPSRVPGIAFVLWDQPHQHPCVTVPSHTVNLLGNLPLKCLDVLLTLDLHEHSLEFMGVNMDVISVLLAFLEKRLNQVGNCDHCFCTVHTSKCMLCWWCNLGNSSSCSVVQPSSNQNTGLFVPPKYVDNSSLLRFHLCWLLQATSFSGSGEVLVTF